ncbi:MAG: hypothetical protein HY323_11705 [Betaproteobacteria bacterium]|nr:hypothetical protein [Betaproteobacteria bacterium]
MPNEYTPTTETERKFETYRQWLEYEAGRLTSYIKLYRRLHERRTDRLDEMNIAPAFFSVTTDALFSAIVLWVDKLFDEHSERGFFNFLTFVEYNREMLSIAELQRRKGYPNGHWMLDRLPITLEVVNEDRARLKNLACLAAFKLRRDKFHAHFDKDYFFDRERFSKEAPITWGEAEELIKVMAEIINHYSSAYDGRLFSLEPININDLDHLLNRLHNVRERK